MSEVTRLLNRLDGNNGALSNELLPHVYDELRRLAGQMMVEERGNHTLTPTALVHEAYFRLVGAEADEHVYNSHAHFFSVAAKAMRRVLIDSARRRKSQKRGGRAGCLQFGGGLSRRRHGGTRHRGTGRGTDRALGGASRS